MENISEMEKIYVISATMDEAIYVADALARHQFPSIPPLHGLYDNKDDKISYTALAHTASTCQLIFPHTLAYATRIIFVCEPDKQLDTELLAVVRIVNNNPSAKITVVTLLADEETAQSKALKTVTLANYPNITFSTIIPLVNRNQASLEKLVAHAQASRKESITARLRLLHDKLYNEYSTKIEYLKNTACLGQFGIAVSDLQDFLTTKPSTKDFQNYKKQHQTNLKNLQWSLSSLSNSLVNSAIPLCIAGVAGTAGYALSLGLFTMLAVAAALMVCAFIALRLSGQLHTNQELRGGPLAFFAFGHKQVAQASFHVAEKLAIMDDKALNPTM